jgi:hypothetical protein
MVKSPTGKSKVISTIKLSKDTKRRLEHLKVYQRETFDEIIQKMLGILNLTRADPERAQMRLMSLDRQRKRTPEQIKIEKEQIQLERENLESDLVNQDLEIKRESRASIP